MVVETLKRARKLDGLRAMDLTELSEDHPEVQALRKSGKDISELK